ncbi:MAG: family 43 glycosylhydrolase [Lachnospiraceae bacterium]|nr:family 43 glycosylhydrolase [Lachnospiraceae bacterium]
MENENSTSFFRELIYLYNAHKKYNMQRFNSLGLSTGQPKVLTILLKNEGFVQKDLAERCMVEPATMTTLLRRMEQSELIYKKATFGVNGKRAMSVFLTEKGRELAEKVEEMARESDDMCLSSLTSEERTVMCVAMRKARVTLEEKLAMEETQRKQMLWKQITGTIVGIFAAFLLTSCTLKEVKQYDVPDTPKITSEVVSDDGKDNGSNENGDTKDDGTSNGNGNANDPGNTGNTDNNENSGEGEEELMELTKAYKKYDFSNPIFTQHFGADPYAIEYDGRLYIYMTADAFEYDSAGKVKENSYGKIQSLYVVSTDDMINFTDHGEIMVAGSKGAAKWAHNSWAPAACWKMIDGKPKFFLYFADNGGGIGVLTADSPTGPFTDPIGKALISRNIPNCGNVLWLFDPAVLVDDDGTGYIYFGGGVPEGKAAAPGTGRVAKLGADMISIDGEVVTLDVPYLFEDSGIHKYKDKYYYTYCTNWSVDQAGTDTYGIHNADIACMVSDSPMGPFEFKEVILRNPGTVFQLWGNNHHCVFKFKDQWYIVYHARTLEKEMHIEKGYRSTHIDCFEMGEDGTIGNIKMTYKSRPQLKYVDPYSVNSAVNVSHMGGVIAADSAVEYGILKGADNNNITADSVLKNPEAEITEALPDSANGGFTYAKGFERGDFIEIQGVDFGDGGKTSFEVYVKNNSEEKNAEFSVFVDDPESDPIAKVTSFGLTGDPVFIQESQNEYMLPEGVHTVFIVCTAGDADLALWRFIKAE